MDSSGHQLIIQATKSHWKSREKLEQIEEDNTTGRQEEIREINEEASGEERRRIGTELRMIGEKADKGKISTEMAVRSLKKRMSIPG